MLRKEPGAEFYEGQYLPCPALGQVESTTGQGNENQGQESGVQAHVGKTAGTLGRQRQSPKGTRLWFWLENLDPAEASVPSSHVQCRHSLRSGGDFPKGARAIDFQVHLGGVTSENNQ